MALSAQVVHFTTRTTTGTQDVTVGFQPKAIIFLATVQTATGLTNGGDRVGMMVGFTDGTNDGACGVAYDTVAENTGGTWIYNNACLALYSDIGTGSGTALVVADLSAWDSDSFTLNYSTVDGSAYRVAALVLGGDSISNAIVVNGQLTGTTHAQTGAGFTPTCGIFAGQNRGTTFNGGLASGAFSLGIATSGTTRRSIGVRPRNNQNADRIFQTDALLTFAAQNPIQDDTWDIDGFDSQGFDLTKDVDNSNSGAYVGLLLAGADVALGTLTQPTSTGAQSVTGLSFQPTAFLAFGAGTANESATSDAVVGVGMATADDEEVGTAWVHSDNSANTAGMSNADDRTLVSRALTSPFGVVADALFTSFNSDGLTVNWQTADATQRLWGYLALGPAAGGASEVSATASAAATASATMQASRAVTVTGAGAATSSVTPTYRRALTVTAAGAATASATAVLGATEIDATAAGAGSASVTMFASRALTSTAAGAADASVTVSWGRAATSSIAGVGTATVTMVVTSSTEVAASAAGTSTVSVTPGVRRIMSVSGAGAGTVDVTMQSGAQLQTAADGTGSASLTVAPLRHRESTVAGSATAAVTPFVLRSPTVACGGTGSATVGLGVVRAFSISAECSATAAAVLTLASETAAADRGAYAVEHAFALEMLRAAGAR